MFQCIMSTFCQACFAYSNLFSHADTRWSMLCRYRRKLPSWAGHTSAQNLTVTVFETVWRHIGHKAPAAMISSAQPWHAHCTRQASADLTMSSLSAQYLTCITDMGVWDDQLLWHSEIPFLERLTLASPMHKYGIEVLSALMLGRTSMSQCCVFQHHA